MERPIFPRTGEGTLAPTEPPSPYRPGLVIRSNPPATRPKGIGPGTYQSAKLPVAASAVLPRLTFSGLVTSSRLFAGTTVLATRSVRGESP